MADLVKDCIEETKVAVMLFFLVLTVDRYQSLKNIRKRMFRVLNLRGGGGGVL